MEKTTILIRLTEAEKTQMKIKANMLGMKLSAYIRHKTLQDETTQPIN